MLGCIVEVADALIAVGADDGVGDRLERHMRARLLGEGALFALTQRMGHALTTAHLVTG